MSQKTHYFASIRYASFYKRVKGLMTAGLFLAGNLVSTLPVMAAPTPSANIVVDTAPPVNQRPTFDVTHNGVDQVNIVHPNGAGVSHNKFNQYNVNEKGQILNNSPTITNTKLAGQITGNPHLKDGSTAHTIINEVTGYSPTKLLGYTEVAGKQAAVIIANPNGITCAGCGFINTSRASLATGRPNLDANGNLQSITVGGGEVGFDGVGGNFTEVPVLDIISRKVRINAPVNGQDIRVVAGRNTYNYADGTATSLPADGSQTPEFSIDTSVLGGMTGNHIQMLVNEKGAGVRVDGRMASTAGDMQLTADGKLVITGELSAQNNLNAHVDVIENTGTIGAENGVELQGRSLTNSGKVIAKGQQNSNINMNEIIDNSGSIEAQSGLQLTAQNIQNHQSASLHAQKQLSLTGQNLINNGQIVSDTGSLQATLNGNLSNNGGTIAANQSLVLKMTGDLNNNSGQIGSNNGNIILQSNDLNNQNGLIQSNLGLIGLTSDSLNNNNGSIIVNNGSININALQFILNNNGQIGSKQSGNIDLVTKNDLQNNNGNISTGTGNIFIQSNKLINSSGEVFTGTNTGYGDLTLRSGDIENSDGVIQASAGGIDARIGSYTDTNGGLIYAGKDIQIEASGDMSIANAIQGQQGLSISARSLTLSNADASLSSLSGNGTVALVNGLINAGNIFVNQGGLAITAGSVGNSGQINTNAGALSITANNGGISNHSGRILTKNDAITLKVTGDLDNSSGQIGSQGNGNITLQSGDLNNQSGLIRTSVGDVGLTIGSLNNTQGSILTTSGNMGVQASQGINNTSGKIGTQQGGNVTITAGGDIDNHQGQFVTPSGLLNITGNTLDNSSGQIGSNNGNVEIGSGKLINTSGTIIAGTNSNVGDLTLTSGDVENSSGTIQSTNGSVTATIGGYTDTNKGVVYAGKDLTLNASGDVSIANAIQSQGQFTLQANNLNIANKDASISSLNGNGSLTIVNDLVNEGNIYASGGYLGVTAASLENSGSLYGKNLLNLNIGQVINNKGVTADNKLVGGMIQSDGDITLTAASFENTGFVKSLQGVNLQLSGDMRNQSFGEYSGVIQSGNGKDIQITTQNLQNNDGQIISDADLNLTIQNTLANSGYLQANTAVNLTTPNLNNNGGSLLALDGDLNIGLSQSTVIDNSNGKIQANGNIIIEGVSYQSSEQSYVTAQQQLQAHFSGGVVNNGQMVGGSDLTLMADSLTNGMQGLIYSNKGNVSLTALGKNGFSNEGNIQAVGDSSQLSINTSMLTNQGVILSKNGAVIDASQQINNQRNQDVFGKIITQGGDLNINAPVVNNDGLIISPRNIAITAQTLANTGYVSADNLLAVTTSNSIANSAAVSGLIYNDTPLVSGSLIGGNAQLSAQTVSNKNGWIQGNNGLTLTANNITNTQKGVILSTNGDVTLQGISSTEGNILPVTSVMNNDSNIQAYNRLWVAAQNLDNTNGVLSSDSGDIRLDQGSLGAALQSFSNVGGTLQSSKDLSLSFSQLDSAQGSKIIAGGLLTLTIGSDFINNGTLWGGQGLNLTLSSLINSVNSIIGADNGNVTIHAQQGKVTNYGVIKNLDSNTGNLSIQTQNLTNDKGSILSNSNIDLQVLQKLINQNGGEITAYNQGNIHFTGNGFDNAGLMLAGGSITGSISGDINNNASGYVYGPQGLTLTSNTQITNNNQGQIGTDSGSLSLTAPSLVLNQGGQVITSHGNVVLNASSGISNHGWLQGMGDILITTANFDNSNGATVSMNGAMRIARDQNGSGLNQIINNNGILQSGGDLTLYTDNLQNQSGKILTYAALGNGVSGNIYAYDNAQGEAIKQLNLTDNGIIQSSKDINIVAQSAGLSSTGSIIANQILNATLNGDVNNNNVVFASSGVSPGSGVHLTVNGDYSISEDGGITSGGNLNVIANNITNNGVLIASNDITLATANLTNNVKGLVSSTNNLTITSSGNIDNYGVLQTDQGSMQINAVGDIQNIGGLIRTQSANGDITLTANSFTNKYSGTLTTENVDTTTVYNTAVNAEGQPYAGMSNQAFTDKYANTTGVKGSDLRDYFYDKGVKILQINAPEGMYTQDGQPASGYFYLFLSNGAGNVNNRVEITATGTQSVLNGNSAIITAGRDLKITTTGAITNDISHIEASKNMQLTGALLENVGHQNDVVYKVACYNKDFCRQLNPSDPSKVSNPNYTIVGTYDGDKGKLVMDGHSTTAPPVHIWGANTVNTGLSGSIVAGGSLIGQFSGQVNNNTIIEHALDSQFTNANPTLPSGKNPTTTNGEGGKSGLTGPGNSDLNSNGTDTNSIAGQDNNIAYSGVTNPQGIDPGLHVTLPGFNGSGSASVNDILSSLTGGQALFRPNPNVSGNSSNLNGITGGGIHGGGSSTGAGNSGGTHNVSNNQDITINNAPSTQSPSYVGDIAANTNNSVSRGDVVLPTAQSNAVNTAPVQSGSNYLIETRPQYTSVNQFYGSQYLLDRLSINGSYMFLGDSGFDTSYIQQQYIQATGQSYPGGTYKTASDAMKTMLDNAASESSKLGLTFGTALTAEQQAALDEDIVWYVPQVVDGQTVLVPQLYLSPKTDVLAGAAIKGKDVSITAGSINNSGLMQGTNSIALTATNGDISNIGGTIKGGNISLNAQNGSVINSDTVNTYLVNGGTGSYLGSQGQIIASGTLGIQASDSITTHGGTIQSGSDLAMKAGTINIGTSQLNAAASSVTHASDGTLAFNGNQTKNYGTSIKAGGNASLQSTTGDLTFAGSTLNATGNVSLSSAGNIGLNAVTDSGLSDVKGHKSGAFSSSSFENKNAYMNDVGSTITSGGQLDVVAKKDISIAGGLAATNDVNVIAKEGSITQNALKSTNDDYTYHHTKKTGFFGSETGLSAQVGTKKNTDKNTTTSVSHTGSVIASTNGNVNMSADKDININGSSIVAKKDVNMAGENVNFNTVQNTTSGDKLHKDSFTGLSVSAGGLIGSMAQTGFSTANATDPDMQILDGATMGYAGLNAGMGKAGLLGGSASKVADYNLFGANASVGHSSNKVHTTTATTTDVGSTVTAGGKVNISAKNDINATASTISGNDVIFNAGGDINLKAGYKTSEMKQTSSSNSFGAGAGVSLGINGGSGSLTGNLSMSSGNTSSSSKTAIDTVVNGTNSVKMNNKNGTLTLNGAQISNKNPDGSISDGSITINTGNLNITTPQNTAKYDSTTVGGGLGISTPIGGGFGLGGKAPEVPYSNANPSGIFKDMHNDYLSTEKTQSGISAGKGGLNVNVAGTTTLNGGSITSAADADKNQITTGSLIANSLDNHSKWSGLNINGSENLSNKHGIGVTGTQNGQDVISIPGNVLGSARPGITGNSVSHNEHSVTNSVIGDNITISAGSVTGTVSRDPNTANGYLTDGFDPNKINNDFNLQNKATQVMDNFASLGINTVVTANNKTEQHQQDVVNGKVSPNDYNDLKNSLDATGHADDFSLVNKNNASTVTGALSAIGGTIIGGGNVGTTAAGVGGGIAGNALYDHFFPEGPLGKDKNPLNPKDQSKDNSQQQQNIGQVQSITPNSSSQQQTQNVDDKPTRYDDTTDFNKVATGIIKDGIVGGLGALAGLATGGNIAIDTATGGLTGLTQNAPKLEKPQTATKAADTNGKVTPSTSQGDKK